MSRRQRTLRFASVIAFVVGVGLMIPFEATLTRVLGIAALGAFVVCGLLTIAEPGFLAEDAPDQGGAGAPGDTPGA